MWTGSGPSPREIPPCRVQRPTPTFKSALNRHTACRSPRMSTRPAAFHINTVLSLAATLLSAGVGVWLLQHAEPGFRAAGVLAIISAVFALLAATLNRPAAPVPPPAPQPAPTLAPPTPPAPKIDPVAIADAGALRLLAKLQEQGRLIDFVMEDIRTVPDAQVAAVARVVHTGCRATLQNAFALEPLHPGTEGSTVTLAPGFDPEAHRLLGHVAGTPPFTGTLLHRGWRTTAIKLPHATDPAQSPRTIIAPAEIELR